MSADDHGAPGEHPKGWKSPTGDESLFAFRTNMVVTASAGTGKTFRLVALYVLLNLGLTSKGRAEDGETSPPVSPLRIAATTFSRAAAAEIRERVERVLRSVATATFDASTEAYRAVLEARAAETGSPEIQSNVVRERARAALAEMPYALVDTLHGLAARIVRASALDLGLTPAYAVLEDDGARASSDTVIEEVLAGALAAGQRAASDLLDAGGGLAMTRRRIAELLDRADEEGVRIDELEHPDFAASALRTMQRLRDLCAGLASEGGKSAAEARAAGAAVERWLEGGGRMAEKELADLLEPLFERRSPARPLPFEEAFFAFRATIRGDNHADRARRLAAFAARAGELSPRARAMGALLTDIAERRSAERRRAGVLGFGDLLRTARDAVRDDAALGETARGMFDVLLVDEFQDTSRVQRDLVYLLRERPARALARLPGQMPTAADLEPAGLLVVGDRKQSIYGFRGADVTVFARVCAELAGQSARDALRLGDEFASTEAPNATLVSLVENRRSDRRILAFVNWFAGQDFDDRAPYPFDVRYAESEHLVPASPAEHGPGLLEAGEAQARRSSEADGPRVIVVDDQGETSADFPPLVRGASAPLREALVAAGVVDRAVREKAFGDMSFGDVAILARRRATLPLAEMALARLGIPYVVAGRGLFETREVRDVFAALRLMVDPFDRHALATVLRGPAACLSDRSLALLSEPGRGLLPPDRWFGFSDRGAGRVLPEAEQEHLRRFRDRFAELRSVGLGLAPADAIRHATEKLDIDRVVAALPHAAQRFGNIERLIAIANERGGTLNGFVRWLERQIADQTDEGEAAALHGSDDAVTLMTIHASKGLEFGAVVLLDMGAAVRAQPLTMAILPPGSGCPARLALRHVHERGGSLYSPEAFELSKENTARELAERRRLTYVAMTRAKRHLFLLVPPAPANGSAAATMRRLLPELSGAWAAAMDLEGIAVESAGPYLARPPRAPAEPARWSEAAPTGDEARPADPPRPNLGPISIPTTSLAVFEQCPRRYRLVHELAVEPPPYGFSPVGAFHPFGCSPGAPGSSGSRDAGPAARDDRRTLGTAVHRVLERWPLGRWGDTTEPAEVARLLAEEGLSMADRDGATRVAANVAAFLGGRYAARLRSEGALVHREEPFVVPVASRAGQLLLRGVIDLLALFPDGSAEIVDYKSSFRPEPDAYDFQLMAYALAARRRYAATRVRVGLLNLAASSAPELTDVSTAELDAFELRLAALRGSFADARSSGAFAGVARPQCDNLRCGFVSACHGA